MDEDVRARSSFDNDVRAQQRDSRALLQMEFKSEASKSTRRYLMAPANYRDYGALQLISLAARPPQVACAEANAYFGQNSKLAASKTLASGRVAASQAADLTSKDK